MARGRTRKSTAKSFGDFKSRKSLQMPGGSSRDLDRERESTRQQYFSGRTDVPASRLDKRKIQADTVDQFKKDFLNLDKTKNLKKKSYWIDKEKYKNSMKDQF